jgi:hypothetical protein
MVDLTRYIETGEDSPSIKISALVGTLAGTVIYGWLQGFLSFLTTVLGAPAAVFTAVGNWLSDVLIPTLVGNVTNPIAAAWASNAAWIDSLGGIGLVIGAIEVMLVLTMLAYGISILTSAAVEVLP